MEKEPRPSKTEYNAAVSKIELLKAELIKLKKSFDELDEENIYLSNRFAATGESLDDSRRSLSEKTAEIKTLSEKAVADREEARMVIEEERQAREAATKQLSITSAKLSAAEKENVRLGHWVNGLKLAGKVRSESYAELKGELEDERHRHFTLYNWCVKLVLGVTKWVAANNDNKKKLYDLTEKWKTRAEEFEQSYERVSANYLRLTIFIENMLNGQVLEPRNPLEIPSVHET
jgi:hypothetical protein